MLNYLYDDLPEYDRFMYMRGYSPEQILASAKKNILNNYLEAQEEDPVEEFIQKVYKELKKN